ELLPPAVEDALHRVGDEIGLRREVVQLGPARYSGAFGDDRGRGPGVADLGEALDRGVEQLRLGRGAALGLGPASPGRHRSARHGGCVPRIKETVKPVCKWLHEYFIDLTRRVRIRSPSAR